ncbi:MAG: FAD-dependent oxidoreductase [Chloroflexota bacterium]|nr:FAD-dependent oxidoreductase [Chloroflexota bacterium]
MRNYDVVVVGGSAAGIPAAITSRRHYPDKSVLVIREQEKAVIPCGIPYIFSELGSCDEDLIPDTVLSSNEIDLLIGKVVDVDPQEKVVEVADGERIGYSKLVLATGSLPVVPPIPGVDMEGVFAIEKSAPYLEQMAKAVDEAKHILIVGCGFIGVEIAEECKRRRDVDIHIVEMLRHCLQLTYDEEFSIRVEEVLGEQGIIILGSEKVEAFVGNERVEGVRLSSGQEIATDMAILGIGSRANVALAEKAGLEIGPTGGIQVNRYMQTTNPDIYACGDCAEKVSFYDGMPSNLKLASIASMEARVAGANLFRLRRANEGVIGVYSTVLGDTAFAAAGLTEAGAREKGYEVIVGAAEAPNRHPSSMPGMAMLRVKLVFEAGTRVLLGGQVSGAKSGGELINAISACIHNRMTADDIATFQTGTHPGLTASPISYQLVNAAEVALAASS